MPALLPRIKITRVNNAAAAGTTDVTASTDIDMADFNGVLYIAALGTLTASQVTAIHAQQSDDDGDADTYSDLEGTSVGPMADDDDNQLLVLDIYRPQKRYVRLIVDRAIANAVVDGVIAIQYEPRKEGTTQDATTVAFSEVHVSPAEGTA